MAKRTGPTNYQLRKSIERLEKLSQKRGEKIWKRVATDLKKPARQRREVNISRINRITKKGEKVLIPGKVLGSGLLEHEVNVIAWNFSKRAKRKIKERGGEAIELQKFLEDPDPEVRVIG